jgi:hypothetical protein
MEGNPIIQSFNMGWNSIIVFSSLVILITILFSYQSTTFFKEYFAGKNKCKLMLGIMYFFVIWFYVHFLFECYVPINNYLSYLQKHSVMNSLLYGVAVEYVYWTNKIGIYFYHISTLIIALFCGLWIALRRVNILKNNVRIQ